MRRVRFESRPISFTLAVFARPGLFLRVFIAVLNLHSSSITIIISSNDKLCNRRLSSYGAPLGKVWNGNSGGAHTPAASLGIA